MNAESPQDFQDTTLEFFEPVEHIETIELIETSELAESEESEVTYGLVEPIRPLNPKPTTPAYKEFEIGSRAKNLEQLGFSLYYPIVDDDSFKILEPGLLIAKEFINLQKVHFLIDTGCLTSVISIDFCTKLDIAYRSKDLYKMVVA